MSTCYGCNANIYRISHVVLSRCNANIYGILHAVSGNIANIFIGIRMLIAVNVMAVIEIIVVAPITRSLAYDLAVTVG